MDPITNISDLYPTNPTNSAIGRGAEQLGQEDFMRLMVAQLENQDPTKPMDNFEFLSQIAQFGTVDGIQGMEAGISQGFADLSNILYANQAVEAAGLVGHKVVTESNVGILAEGETFDATIELPQSSPSVTLYIQDMNGELLHTRQLGDAPAGGLQVQWDGMGDDGSPAPPGQYRVSAEAVLFGDTQTVSAYSHSLVDSVTVDRSTSNVVLNLAGGSQMDLSQVKSFL